MEINSPRLQIPMNYDIRLIVKISHSSGFIKFIKIRIILKFRMADVALKKDFRP